MTERMTKAIKSWKISLPVILAAAIIAHITYMALHHPIQYWIGKGDIERIKRYLESGADPNERLLGYTPLTIAVMNDNQDVASYFLEHGADPNATNDQGQTPLHLAVRAKNLEMVRTLLRNGADPNRSTEIYPLSPLELAISMEQMPLIRVFVEQGAMVKRAFISRVNDPEIADYLRSHESE